MANDVISKIVLQAQGGDAAAREIGKTTKAFKEAGEAASGMQGSTSGGKPITFDAFQKAGGIPGMAQRQQSNQNYHEGMNQRTRDHFSRFGGAGGSGGGMSGGGLAGMKGQVSTVAGGVTSVAQGNVAGGGQALQSLSGAGPVGIAVAAAIGAGMAIKGAADKDYERQVQYGHGLMQRAGLGNRWKDDGGMNDQIKAIRSAGMTDTEILSYLSASTTVGATVTVAAMEIANRATLATGASGGAIAAYQGARQKFGIYSDEAQLVGDIGRASGAFGSAGVDKFLSTVSTSIEGAMARGYAKGSIGYQEAYDSGTRMLSALSITGGMTQEGAIQTYNQVNSAVSGLQNMGSSAAAFQFMAQRKEGESYGDTVRRISSFGGQMEAYKNIKAMTGGNRELLEIELQKTFGLDWQALDPFIKTMENQIMDKSLRGASTGSGVFESDDYLIESTQARQKGFLDEARETAGTFVNWLLNPGAKRRDRKAREAEVEQMFYAGLGGESTVAGMKESGTLGPLPPELAGFAAIAASNADEDSAMIMDNLLPQLAGYEAYRQGGEGMSSEEIEMYKQTAPFFDSIIDVLKDPTAAQWVGSTEGMSDFSMRANMINNMGSLDHLYNLVTVVELLQALNEKMGLESLLSDQGATESGQ